jgi:hypothetical protein
MADAGNSNNSSKKTMAEIHYVQLSAILDKMAQLIRIYQDGAASTMLGTPSSHPTKPRLHAIGMHKITPNMVQTTIV